MSLDTIGTFEHIRITPVEFKTAFSGVCGIGDVQTVTEIRDGVNVSAILHTDTGEYFVKLNTFNGDDDVFQSQPFILQELFASDEIQTPTPIAYDYTQSGFDYDWYMTKRITGECLDATTDTITPEKAKTVGHILGEINSIPVDGMGFPKTPVPKSAPRDSCSIPESLPFTQSSWKDGFTDSVLELVGSIDSRFSDLREPLVSYVECVDVREPDAQLLHFDYWWENLLWGDDCDPYVIDWERSVAGDPLANLLLSEHYLFDTLPIETDAYKDQYVEERSHLRTVFRDAYEQSYSGVQTITADEETRTAYQLLPYLRELRGFPYWWRDQPRSWKQTREQALRETVEQLVL